MASPTVSLSAPKGELPQGVSLVTCCKDRNVNLLRAIPSWLAQPEISEIIIVDWESRMPVAQDLANAGISDPRIRIARVKHEPDWILSYAFNIGFRLVQFSQVLKTDADIVLSRDYFIKNTLEQGRFIAGNWRSANEGQQFVNGFFQVHTADLLAVSGFNEYITTYGWDDDDLYDRLSENGTTRQDVAPNTVNHLDHEDSERLLDQHGANSNGWSDLNHTPMFKIRTNRFISLMMPKWNKDRRMRPYSITNHSHTSMVLQRAEGTIFTVPEQIERRAKHMAAMELVSWQAGVRSFGLAEERLDLLLSSHRLSNITPLLIELALSDASLPQLVSPRILLVDLDKAAVTAGTKKLVLAGDRLAQMAFRSGRLLVVRSPFSERPSELPGTLAAAPYIPAFAPVGHIRDVDPEDVRRDAVSPVLRLQLNAKSLKRLPKSPTVTSEDAAAWVKHHLSDAPDMFGADFRPLHPAIQTDARSKLYIDTQHGLGNRLRAIGSAHAVANATGRELVIIWEPDHHCQGSMHDLFAYEGAVLEKGFLPQALNDGATVLNYMEIEEGAAKDAPLSLTQGRDAYVRSAYILNHPASSWSSENQLLRQLVPIKPVQELLSKAGPPADIGLHIRMEGAPGSKLDSYDAPENWTEEGHAAIQNWREKSHYRHFISRLDTLLKDQPDARVFLAADQPQTYKAFTYTYGDRVTSLERRLFDRSAEQLQYALADILALARCRHLLGSNWSSFSEAAQRMSTTLKTVEVAGRDF